MNRGKAAALYNRISALFTRAMRLDCRSPIVYTLRLALATMLLLYLMIATGLGTMAAAPGRGFFAGVIYLDLIFILLVGISQFASAVTEEKEACTLGLLLMTGLEPLAILFGKSTSRLLRALLLLAAQLPFTLLAITLGGVGLNQVLAAYATLAAFTFFLCNLALLASVVAPRTQEAVVFTGLALLGLGGGPQLIKSLLSLPGIDLAGMKSLRLVVTPCNTLINASPLPRLAELLSTGFNAAAIGFQVWSNLVAGIICFVLARLLFFRFAHEQQTPAPRRVSVLRRPDERGALAPPRAWRAALQWKEFHFVVGGRLGIVARSVLLGLVAGAAAAPAWLFSNRLTFASFGLSLVRWSLILAIVEAAYHASRIFQMEVRWGTLPMVFMLPMSTRALAYRKTAGALVALTPYAVGAALGLLCVARDLAHGDIEQAQAFGGMTSLVFTALHVVLFTHLTAFFSLVMKRGGVIIALAAYVLGLLLVFPSLAFVTYLIAMNTWWAGLFHIVVIVTVTTVLHVAIGRRLERAAGQVG